MAPPLINIRRISSAPVILGTIFLLQTWMSAVLSVELNLFYPFGTEQGDRVLKAADEFSSEDVRVEESFFLYNNSYRNIYVNTNGHISFDSEFPAYRLDVPMPLGYHLIAPFYADIDTRGTGHIYFRNTTDQDGIQRAAAEIQTYFSGFQDFMPTSLFIVTWHGVGYFDMKTDFTNTFQLVLVSDGKNTFSIFYYLDNGINWQSSDGKFSPSHQDIPPQAGFDGGPGGKSYMLPGSGEKDASFVTGSNVNIPGVWMFQIGNIAEGNVRPADLNIEDVKIFKPKAQSGCSQPGVCHANAECVENDRDFCCACKMPYYGNGLSCLRPGVPQSVNSVVRGTLNGVTLPAISFMHTYILTVEGRIYSALSPLQKSIAPAALTLNTISEAIGWLFATPINRDVENGFSQTGGKLNRTATITYQSKDGSPDRVVRIQQRIFGHQAQAKLRMVTSLSGNMPDIPLGAKVTIDDFTESYSKSRKGVITSHSQRTYRVNNVAYRYTVDNTINFQECDDGQRHEPVTTRVSVSKQNSKHDINNDVVRFAMSFKIGNAGGVDDCTSLGLNCNANADCVSRDGRFQCVCGSGYQGNGVDCRDVDECQLGICDVNARCQNIPGTFRCICNSGYTGNGRTCKPDANLCGGKVCDPNARCTFDPAANTHTCECRQGFRMDRDRCIQQERDCRRGGVCGPNAQCVLDDMLNEYVCECMDDFSGDGYSCEAIDPGCNVCDRNAECVQNTFTNKQSCQCGPGYTGDGVQCDQIDTCARCDSNAQCVYDDRRNVHVCVCVRGYTGNGEQCVEADCRNVTGMCAEEGGLCWLNPATDKAICRCNYGYRGDGFRCSKVGCDVYNNCDRNAKCVEERSEFVCKCNEGFVGTGSRCRPDGPTTCDVYNDCDRNARCTPDASDPPVYTCRCIQNYRGDGKRCELIGEPTCNEVNNCDRNAACRFNNELQTYECVCNDGYRGMGTTCEKRDEYTCTDYNDCDRNARCVPIRADDDSTKYVCRCNSGFTGNGKQCDDGSTTATPTATSLPLVDNMCESDSDCGTNANCVQMTDENLEVKNVCRCSAGWRGDGIQCERETVTPRPPVEHTCTNYNDCDRNARCHPMRDGNGGVKYVCRCNPGFRGDGKQCEGEAVTPRPAVEHTCTNYNDCDRNARCYPMRDGNGGVKYVCRCNPGFRGDGKQCEGEAVTPRPLVEHSCTDYNDCDRNARCTPKTANGSIFICQCNPGFRGDGRSCQQTAPTSCNQVNNCDQNAACVHDPDAQSYRCVCNRGYEGDGLRCRRKEIIDCRRDPRLCANDAECKPGAGAEYVCVCKPGYRGDGATCSYVVVEGEALIYAQGFNLMRVSLDPKPRDYGQQIAYLPDQSAVGVGIDCKEGNIYWTDVRNGVIRRSNMVGENMETIISGLKSPEAVAIDFSARNMFFSDSILDVVQVAKLDGSSIKTLVDTDMVNPRAIALDITRGVVFWTDWNRNKPQIEKINMDGTGRTIVVYNDLGLPNGLAYDSFSQVLCWADAGNKKIECVKSDGTSRRVVHASASYPFDMTMINNNIYWSDWKKKNIPSVNINSGALNTPLALAIGGHGRLYGIAAVRDQCPRERNSCSLNNGGCKYLCLASPNGGRTCACPDGTDPRLC